MSSKTQPPNMLNFGGFYYPPAHLTKGLEKLIIFTENTTKKEIPNGSVFVYSGKDYNPFILMSDVGCGIAAFIVDGLTFDEQAKTEILKAVNYLGIHIGQGNHFLDFTTAHPILKRKNSTLSMIYLHSDFNNENVLPTSYQEAKELEIQAKNKRIDYLQKLTKLLEVSAKFYNDWMHNSVNLDDGRIVYRKGAINLNETNGVGLLALNPIDGLMLYAAEFKDYQSSMQHGLGRIGSRSELQELMHKQSVGIAKGYSITRLTPELKATIKNTYRSIDDYLMKFGHQQAPIGVCATELVVSTKR